MRDQIKQTKALLTLKQIRLLIGRVELSDKEIGLVRGNRTAETVARDCYATSCVRVSPYNDI